MAVNQQRYRQLQFEGTDILEARELNWLQEIAQGTSLAAGGGGGSPVSSQLSALYRQGGLFNVTVAVSGLTVTLSATNPSLPMLVFVRDRWETIPTTNDTFADNLSATIGANAVFHLLGTETTIYLSWQLFQQTGGLTGSDPSLSDPLTNQPTGNAGELQLALSTLSGVGSILPGAYYGLTSGGSIIAVNTSLIPIITFTNNGTALTHVSQDNILTPALASTQTSGFVSVDGTYGGSGSEVVATNDSRLGTANVLGDGSVHDSTVRTPVASGGTNSNSTPVYKLPVDGGSDIGGISAAKIILLATTQTLEAGWNWFLATFNALQAAFSAHYTAQLGLSNTHPVPTPSQVGAAPSSHVGQPLGTIGSTQAAISHPGVIATTTGGFQVNQPSTGAALDPAYGVFTSGVDIASLNHDGDVYSVKSNALIASNGGGRTGNGVGAMGLISHIATALTQHVNQVTNANPHGLSLADLNGAVALSTSPVLTTGLNGGSGQWVILTFNNGGVGKVTFAVGMGTAYSSPGGGDFGPGSTWTIPLPTSPTGFVAANALSSAAVLRNDPDGQPPNAFGSRQQFFLNYGNKVSALAWNFSSWKIDSDGSAETDDGCWASWTAVAWIG